MNWPGHSAVLHGCTVEDEAFVGMGATLLDGVVVEKNAMVAAGALVRQNTRIPCGEVCLSIFIGSVCFHGLSLAEVCMNMFVDGLLYVWYLRFVIIS